MKMEKAQRPKILLVGHHPNIDTGNGQMMAGFIRQLDLERYEISVLAVTPPKAIDPFEVPKYTILEAIRPEIAGETLLSLCGSVNLDIIAFVGLDIWEFAPFIPRLNEIKNKTRFKTIAVFPWDTCTFREDWLKMVEMFDFPCVYSLWGYEQLKDKVPNIRYFRPASFKDHHIFRRFSPKERMLARKKFFPITEEETFILGFVGNNQFRKDPLRLVKAFFLAKEKFPNMCLYMHTEMLGKYNIKQYVKDLGGKMGDVFSRDENPYTREEIVGLYNCFDVYVLPSLQEGLSLTILEAMKCGTPVIASHNTAHMELLDDDSGLPVECTEFFPLLSHTESGISHIEAWACDLKDLTNKILMLAENKGLREELSIRGLKKAEEWIDGIDDFSKLVEDVLRKKNTFRLSSKLERVLFAQHSSAGDVLMTTRCLVGLRERFKGMPLDYMTSRQYMEILEGNPHIEHILPWDEKTMKNYRYVVNPHGERILPGHWGRNSNSLLADFYWKILKITPTKAIIIPKQPEDNELTKTIEQKAFIVVHTTGGDPEFRSYYYMPDVCSKIHDLGFVTVQLGGEDDVPAGADIDLRGKTTFRESAWIMKKAVFAITVDSFMSHLAGFLDIPQVCLFGSGNHNVVKPVGRTICMVPDYVNYCKGLGPCSGAVKDCPVKCTGIHEPEAVVAALKYLISWEVQAVQEIGEARKGVSAMSKQ